MDRDIRCHQSYVHPDHPITDLIRVYVSKQKHDINHSHVEVLVHDFQLGDQRLVKRVVRVQVSSLEYGYYE
jgi:hypothetical protein